MLTLATSLGLRTNLIIEEGLPHIFKKPRNVCMAMNRVFRQEPQPPFDVLKVAGRNSAIKSSKGEWCCTVSLHSDGLALLRYLEPN